YTTGKANSSNRCCSHRVSFVAMAIAIYSASVVEVLTVFCFLLYQPTVLPASLITAPDCDLRSPLGAKLASAYTTRLDPSRSPRTSFFSLVVRRYRNTCLQYFQIRSDGRLRCRDRKLTAAEMSGRVMLAMNSKPPTRLRTGSASFTLSSSVNSMVSMGGSELCGL